MARKKKATTSGDVAETAMPHQTTAITPAAEADTVPEMVNEHSGTPLPATDVGGTTELNLARMLTPEAADGPASFAKVVTGNPEYTGGPRPIMTVNLSGYSGGPSMHLLRSLKYRQLQIRFDNGQPDEQYLAMLRRANWIDRSENEGVWTKQIDPNARWQSVDRMEQEFKSIANAIRKEKGLEPVLQGMSVA